MYLSDTYTAPTVIKKHSVPTFSSKHLHLF